MVDFIGLRHFGRGWGHYFLVLLEFTKGVVGLQLRCAVLFLLWGAVVVLLWSAVMVLLLLVGRIRIVSLKCF